MGVIVSGSDFVGYWAVPVSLASRRDAIIAKKEEEILNELLGADLYAAFKAAYIAPPMPSYYQYIFDKFYKDYNECLYKSKGMKEMLLNLIWFEIMRDIPFKATQDGIVVNAPDTSKAATIGNLYQYYNDGADTYNTIQFYIAVIKPSDYTVTFNGIPMQRAIPTFG